MFWNKETEEKFPPHIFKTIDGALRAKSKGMFGLRAGQAHVLPHVYSMLIDDAPEAKIDQAINLADDLQNSLAKIGIFQNVTVRPFPLRVEVDRKNPVPIPLSKYWNKILNLSVNDGGISPAVIYRGGKEILVDLALSSQQNSHIGIFGTTGSGKTIMAMSALLTLAYRNSPAKMGLVLCDPTGKNFKPLADLPHLMAPMGVTIATASS
jgi:S-DNA-T family DNA segregation ATPase FtsK/SpoIIIE